MTRKTYCGNLLWQSGLTLLAPTPNRDNEEFFKRKMVGLHREIGAARMHELGHGTREQFADAQAKLIYGSLPEPATPGGAATSETNSN